MWLGGTQSERPRLLDEGPHREEWEEEQKEKVGIHGVPMVCTLPSTESWNFTDLPKNLRESHSPICRREDLTSRSKWSLQWSRDSNSVSGQPGLKGAQELRAGRVNEHLRFFETADVSAPGTFLKPLALAEISCTVPSVRSICVCQSLGCVWLLWSHGLQPTRLLCPWNSPGKNSGVGCHFLLQGIFLTQELNLGLLHCRWILYHLSHLQPIKCV